MLEIITNNDNKRNPLKLDTSSIPRTPTKAMVRDIDFSRPLS